MLRAALFATIVLAGGAVARDNIIYRNPQAAGVYDRRQYTDTEWKYLTTTLHVNAGGASTFSPLIGPHISRLFVLRISACYGSGVITGDTVLTLADITGGVPTTLATLTIPMALATFTEVTQVYQVTPTTQVEIGPSNMVVLAVSTDGGHRDIFATAYAGQSPLRR